ncbi:hypothetical protein ATB53_12285 [Xanthomonas translucens]|uniref:Uncharacterized protein n=1 Tax=Xanthomonas campestris pv. translucens TaxID=343 RepID=A0A125PUT7_XANCT|nr:hypothetical protein OZ12_13450 [Xanthomonas translucens pv. translucens]KWV11132.1 hypothetical protein ATB54_18325 [Xanthomonas translucens]KWV15072.1 hypothetical protein ATB53_12285 [Xanthomonas translucens]OAX60245.1 hypothetical protein A6R79_11225 [Xanthomonas translucens pv. translucens]
MPIGWTPLLRYSDGGVWAEPTLQLSAAALADIALHPRALCTMSGLRLVTQAVMTSGEGFTGRINGSMRFHSTMGSLCDLP